MRKNWLDKLQLVKMYRYSHGNSIGTMTFLWRIPTDSPEDPTVTAQAISSLNSRQKQYCTRQMRKHFLMKYGQFMKALTSVLRHNYVQGASP